jgi:CSLREA domain-containing protein/uncharacterized repeat protein (TIGR01451 family)
MSLRTFSSNYPGGFMGLVKWLGSRRRLLVWVLMVLGGLGFAGSASASTFTVTTTADSNDGSCTTSKCSLRDAVVAADHAGGSSTIDVPAGVYKLTIKPAGASGCSTPSTGCDADDPTHGDLDIDNNASVRVIGAGSGSTVINAHSVDRGFAVQKGSSLSVSKLTIENGEASAYSSGAVALCCGGPPATYGGAVYSDGTLTVTRSILDQNISAAAGGDIYADVDAPSTQVTSSVLSHSFSGDSEGYGAAVDIEGGTFTVAQDRFDTNGTWYDYGTVYLDSGKPTTITDSTFFNGDSGDGGAITDNSGRLKIVRSTFTGNAAVDGDGGALELFQSRGDVSITRSTFSGNSSAGGDDGGAIYFAAGSRVSLRILHSVFSDNAAQNGGAIYYNDGKGLRINRSWFTGNQSEYGGGLYVDSSAGTLTIEHSTLDHGGAAYEEGGGLYLANSSATSISNTTISYNHGGYGGGIYFDTTVPAQLTNDTIAHNQAGTGGTCGASGCGGGISGPSSATGIVNTIVADNAGGDCDAPAGSADQGYNMDSDGSCFRSSGTPEATGDKTGNPRLGPLQDNGGPAPTELPKAGSPAINTANNAACPADDERGVLRPQPPGGQCDRGAVEVAVARLKLTKHAPHRATQGDPFTYKIRVTDSGPGPSTGTVLVDRLPKGETVYGVTPSQGTCTASGSPTKVVCDLGTVNWVNTGLSHAATVTLLVSDVHAGQVVNTAHVHNDQGSSVSASATTKVVPAAGHGQAPNALTGQAGHVSVHSATLRGEVKPGGQATSYFFQYRRAGSPTWNSSALGHTGSKAERVSAQVSGLSPRTKYEFRLVATNDQGTSYGATRTLRTGGKVSRKRKHARRVAG